jgi:hypothetical protein
MSQADADRAQILGLLTSHADRITALERRLERVCGLFAFFIALAAAYGAKHVCGDNAWDGDRRCLSRPTRCGHRPINDRTCWFRLFRADNPVRDRRRLFPLARALRA